VQGGHGRRTVAGGHHVLLMFDAQLRNFWVKLIWKQTGKDKVEKKD
jgi:hypothetical protein